MTFIKKGRDREKKRKLVVSMYLNIPYLGLIIELLKRSFGKVKEMTWKKKILPKENCFEQLNHNNKNLNHLAISLFMNAYNSKMIFTKMNLGNQLMVGLV